MVHQLIYILSVVMSITGGFLQAPGVADSAEFGSRIPGRYNTNSFIKGNESLDTSSFIKVFIRVADPWHFCADPDPANQNFKNGSGFGSGSVSRIRILLIKKAHIFPVPHIFLLVL